MALTIIRNTLSLRFMRQLVETAAGRAHILNQVADAEDNGESQIFERILAEVEDPVLRKVISRHQADEVRHAALLRARCEATGVDVGPVPMSIRLIARLDAAAGGCSTRTIRTHSDVMEAYVLLQVIEERAITQFSLLAQAFRPVDPESADLFVRIGRDEERHLRYCLAVTRRCAPSEKVRVAALARYRELEARCFRDNSSANLNHCLERGYLDAHPLSARIWRALDRVAAGSCRLPFTSYHFQTA